MGRGWVGKHESPTLTPASAAHRQASGTAVSKQGPLLNLLLILSSQRQAAPWKFSVHVQVKPSLRDFEHYLASVWNECNFGLV